MPEELAGEDVLEVGSGARAHQGAAVIGRLFERGRCEPAQQRSDRGASSELFQASIYEMPFRDGSFDKVFSLGVLQHTPDFEASVRSLVAKVKPGGEIVVDFYPIHGWWTKLNAKYLLRPITGRMSDERLLKIVDQNID